VRGPAGGGGGGEAAAEKRAKPVLLKEKTPAYLELADGLGTIGKEGKRPSLQGDA